MRLPLKILTPLLIIMLMAGFPAYAQVLGAACTPDQLGVKAKDSVVPTQGVLECIPDSNGNYWWQAMGAGTARYDTTGNCSVAGQLRWNGSSIQYCDGLNWQAVGGMTVVMGGCQTYWSDCPAGYVPTSYFSPGTYNCCDRCGNPAWRYTVCSQ